VAISQVDLMLLSTDVPGRIAHIRLDPRFASLSFSPTIPAGCSLVLPATAGRSVALARIGDVDLTVGADGTISLPTMFGESRLALTLVYG
jgi:hypothetical protein